MSGAGASLRCVDTLYSVQGEGVLTFTLYSNNLAGALGISATTHTRRASGVADRKLELATSEILIFYPLAVSRASQCAHSQ